MFDLGWTELLVIGIVALIVVGPKDLPVLFRNAGRWVGKMRGMAREFSQAMNDAADQSGINDVAKTIKTATNPLGSAMDGVKDATRDLTKGLDITKGLDAGKGTGKGADPDKYDADSETGKLAAERAEAAKKIQAATARAAAERKAREAADELAKVEAAEAEIAKGSDT